MRSRCIKSWGLSKMAVARRCNESSKMQFNNDLWQWIRCTYFVPRFHSRHDLEDRLAEIDQQPPSPWHL